MNDRNDRTAMRSVCSAKTLVSVRRCSKAYTPPPQKLKREGMTSAALLRGHGSLPLRSMHACESISDRSSCQPLVSGNFAIPAQLLKSNSLTKHIRVLLQRVFLVMAPMDDREHEGTKNSVANVANNKSTNHRTAREHSALRLAQSQGKGNHADDHGYAVMSTGRMRTYPACNAGLPSN